MPTSAFHASRTSLISLLRYLNPLAASYEQCNQLSTGNFNVPWKVSGTACGTIHLFYF
eukprot:IDg4108t1